MAILLAGSLLELERVLDFLEATLEEILGALLVLLALDLGELSEQFFLAGCERLWNYHAHRHQFIPARVAMHQRHTLALQAEGTPTLRARRNLERLLAVERGRLNFGPDSGVGEAHRQLVENVAGLSLEVFVRLDVEGDEQIARRATTRRRLTLARHPDSDAIIHASGDIDRHPAHIAHAPLAVA